MGFYPPDALVHEAQRRGIEVLPPDVNASEVGCTVTDGGRRAHRPGLRAGRARRRGRRAGRRAPCRRPVPLARRPRLARRRGPAGARAACLVGRLRRACARRAGLAVAGSGVVGDGVVGDGVVGDGVVGDGVVGDGVVGTASRGRVAGWRRGDRAPDVGPAHRAVAAGDRRARLRGRRRGTQLALPLDLPQAPALAAVGAWDAMIADYATTGLTTTATRCALLRDGLTARGTVSSAELGRPAARRRGARRRPGRRAPAAGNRQGRRVPAARGRGRDGQRRSSRRASTSATG